MMDMSQYLGIFIDEAKEHVQSMNQGLLALEKEPENESFIEQVFRAAHTLKGMSATMGFEAIAELTHAMENILDKIRHQEIRVTPESMDTLFKCLDTLEEFLTAVSSGEEHYPEVTALIADLQNHLVGKAQAAATVEAATEAIIQEVKVESKEQLEPIALSQQEWTEVQEEVEKGLNPLRIRVTLDENCVLKSARA